MSYFVLTLGGLLALCGAFALFTSYGIILDERGWAGVISGTTALACGLVTIALGLILHRLSRVYDLLKAGGDEPSSPRHILLPEAAQNSAAVPRFSGLRGWPQRQARVFYSPGRGFFKVRGVGVPEPPRAREPPPSPSDGKEGTPDLPSEQDLGSATSAEAAAERGTREGMILPSAPADETADAGRAPHAALQLPETPIDAGQKDVQPRPGSGWPAEPVMMETIVRQEGTESAERPLPEMWEAARSEPPAVTFEALAGAHPAEPQQGNEPAPDDAISGDTVAIVGRYESEGASFVRYADGSIEARTDHAVFHFKSMAELKRFMESQAQARQGQTPKQ
ncbi:MAG TPA: hypothetical protein VKE72_04240 [Methylocella sp.]|nr:hypothetical protein [Methylocella sp.]